MLRGCDPKKVLFSVAEAADSNRRMNGHGLAGEARIDWATLMKFKRNFTEPVPARQEANYRSLGIEGASELQRKGEGSCFVRP